MESPSPIGSNRANPICFNGIFSADEESSLSFHKLPFELIQIIFSFNQAKELVLISLACKAFKQISEDRGLWKGLLKLDFPRKGFLETASAKSQYVYFHHTEQNWKKGLYTLQTMKVAPNYCSPKFLVGDEKIICEGNNCSITIRDMRDETSLLELEGHPGCDQILSFVDSGEHFISRADCGEGVNGRLWTKQGGTCLLTWDGCHIFDGDIMVISHGDQIEVHKKDNGNLLFAFPGSFPCVFDENYLYAPQSIGFMKNSEAINIWERHGGKFIAKLCPPSTIQMRMDPVTVLYIENDLLFSGHASGSIRIWNKCTRDHRELKKETEIPESVASLLIEGDYLFSEHRDSKFSNVILKCWNKNNGSLLYTLKKRSNFIIDDERLISATEEGRIMIWNKHDGSPIFAMEGNYKGFHRLVLNDNRLCSEYINGINIWDINTGALLLVLKNHYHPTFNKDQIICSGEGAIHVYDFGLNRRED